MFGDEVRRHRRRLSLTQEELASIAGLSARRLREIESGRTGRPRPSTVRLLADAFGLSGEIRDMFCELALSPADAFGKPPPIGEGCRFFAGTAGATAAECVRCR